MRTWIFCIVVGWTSLTGCTPTEAESDKSDDATSPLDAPTDDIVTDTDPVEDTASTEDIDDSDTENTDDSDTEDTEDSGTIPKTWELEVNITADDSWQMWIDGEPAGAATGWSVTDVYESEVILKQDGPHVIAVHAYDLYNVISGFIAYVTVDGEKKSVTGDGRWRMVAEEPDASWFMPWYDDSQWSPAQICAVTAPWGTNPVDLTQAGAQWIWYDSNCYVLGQTWFRLEFQIP